MNEIIITGMLSVVFLLMCAISYILDLIAGDAELPKLRRKYRGMVGKKIRRTRYEYIEILPDYTDSGKSFRVVRVRR
jgi:hypothetical protein